MNEINFVSRLLGRIFIIGLLVGGGWLCFNDTQAQATVNQTVQNVRDRIAKLTSRDDTSSNDSSNLHLNDTNNGSPKSSQKPTAEQQTSTQTSIPSTGRWVANQATAYVSTSNAQLDAATNTATQGWNQTGAFTFKPVNDQNKANIVVIITNRSDLDAAGLTKTPSNSLTRRFMYATVYLNTYYLTGPSYGYSQERIVNIVGHELGYAIELDHISTISVTQPAEPFYTIQSDDV